MKTKLGLGVVSLAVLCAAFLVSTPAARADLVYSNVGSGQTFCCFQVDLKQLGSNTVSVDVTLKSGATKFVSTGSGNHPGFGFNLPESLTTANFSNVSGLNLSSLSKNVATTGPALGIFSYVMDVATTGGSGSVTELKFDITVAGGISINDFTTSAPKSSNPGKSAGGIFFATDLMNAAGKTGESWIDTPPTTTKTPEPASLFLLGSGLVGLAIRRRK